MAGLIAHDRLLHLVEYDPETGIITWRNPPPCPAKKGDPAGCLHHTGYFTVRLDNRVYQSSHIAWFYVHGVWPEKHVDHINGNPADNRICNLRPATRSQNMANRRIGKNNTTGFKGVTVNRGRFAAEVVVRGKRRWLGRFDTPEEAHAAYVAAAVQGFGEFARAG